MAEFTPGPWVAELGEIHEIRDTEGGRVCILTQLRGRHGLGGRRADGESSSNANLIAAAPEMYEVLERFVDADSCNALLIAEFTTMAIDVLAKAEGKSNG